jgi:Hypothetical methyltransferase
MIEYLQSLPTSTVIADMGCGDAKIAHTLTKHKVLSFDLVAKNDKVVACDIAKVGTSYIRKMYNYVEVANHKPRYSSLFQKTLSMLSFSVFH